MPTFEVKLEDGRRMNVISSSSDESIVKKQANHSEITRMVIATRRGQASGPDPALAVSVTKIKE